MRRTLRLVQFLDIPLRGTTENYVPGTSTAGGVHWLAGSGARSRVGAWGTGLVTCATPAVRMLPVILFFSQKKKNFAGDPFTYHTCVIGTIDGRYEFAIIATTTELRSKRGTLDTAVIPAVPRG